MWENQVVTLFYSLGSIFLVLCIVFVISLIVILFTLYRKVIALQQQVAVQASRFATKTMSLKAVTGIAPIIITTVVNTVLKRFNSRS